MGKGQCTFRKSDVRRAVTATTGSGIKIRGVRFARDGTFEVIAADPDEVNDDGRRAVKLPEETTLVQRRLRVNST